MEYWHNLITQKSFQILKELNKKYDFILIGGWAVFLYTKALKSKDIDIVMEYEELSEMRSELDIFKNLRLKKYEAKRGGIDVDIYLPYFSNPGLPAEEIKKFVISKQGFKIPLPEILLILKQKVFKERKDSPKGNKDKLDIFSLFMLKEFNWQRYKKFLKNYKTENLIEDLKKLLEETFEIKELNLSRHKIAKLKKKISEDIS